MLLNTMYTPLSIVQLSIALLCSLLVLLVVLCLLDLFGIPHPIRCLFAVPCVLQDSLSH
jgi:hypothetical protein